MTASVPTQEPTQINAGDTAKWSKDLPNYLPSDGWLLSYTLVNAAQRIAFSSSASGANHLVNVAAASTAAYVAGKYDYRGLVTKAAEVFTVSSGRITINPAFGAVALDARSQARKQLEAVEATLEGRATSATAEYEIAGRKMKYIPIPELLQLRDRLRADVAREDSASRMAAGLGQPGRIYVRFGA